MVVENLISGPSCEHTSVYPLIFPTPDVHLFWHPYLFPIALERCSRHGESLSYKGYKDGRSSRLAPSISECLRIPQGDAKRVKINSESRRHIANIFNENNDNAMKKHNHCRSRNFTSISKLKKTVLWHALDTRRKPLLTQLSPCLRDKLFILPQHGWTSFLFNIRSFHCLYGFDGFDGSMVSMVSMALMALMALNGFDDFDGFHERFCKSVYWSNRGLG